LDGAIEFRPRLVFWRYFKRLPFEPEETRTKRKVIITAVLAIGLGGNSNGRSKLQSCPYPAEPINWVSAYCSYLVGTDDEIAIQESKCFTNAEPDLKSTDQCSINKKYKTKICDFLIKHKHADYKSVDACLKDKGIRPFFAGE